MAILQVGLFFWPSQPVQCRHWEPRVGFFRLRSGRRGLGRGYYSTPGRFLLQTAVASSDDPAGNSLTVGGVQVGVGLKYNITSVAENVMWVPETKVLREVTWAYRSPCPTLG